MKIFDKLFGSKRTKELKIDYHNEINKIEYRYSTLKKYIQNKTLVISIETNLMSPEANTNDIINGLVNEVTQKGLPYVKIPTISNRKKSIYGIDIGNKNGSRDIAYIIICQLNDEVIDWDFYVHYLSHSDLIIGVNPLVTFEELKDYFTQSYALNYPENDMFEDYIYDSKHYNIFRTSIQLEN